MSLTSEEKSIGAGGVGSMSLATQQAPRLQAGGYAQWRPNMEVHLSRIGADGVHKKALSAELWKARSEAVVGWAEEAEDDAWSTLGLSDTGAVKSESASASSSTPVKD